MKTACVIVMIAGCWSASVFAQLGHANLDGLQVDVRHLSRHGDTRDLDCSLGMVLQGEKVTSAPGISSARVLRAVDDTGRDLLRTNGRSGAPFPSWSVARLPDGFWLSFELKSPAAGARCIRLLECEAELPAGTSSPPRQTFRFSLENIRLPWVDPPEMQVLVGSPRRLAPVPKHSLECQLLLTFAGGRIPSAAGMRELRIQRAEDEAGRVMAVRERPDDKSQGPPRFSPLENPSSSTGRYIERQVVLKAQTPRPTKLRLLQGEAELCFPSLANGGLVDFDDFLLKKGEPLHSDALKNSRVKVRFVGRDNFATRKRDWQQNRITLITVLPQTTMPADIMDSLHFTIEDPENRTIKLEFLDTKGETLPVLTQITSSETFSLTAPISRMYTFTNPPPEGTRLRIYLAAPGAMERVAFKVENAPL